MASRAGPAAISAAMAVVALVAANRSTKGRPTGERDEAGARGTGASAIGRDLRSLPLDHADPAASPTKRRLPTGLY